MKKELLITALVVLMVAGCGMSGQNENTRKRRETDPDRLSEEQAIDAIKTLGAKVEGRDTLFFSVSFKGLKTTDDDLKKMKRLTSLGIVNLKGTQITDAGLEHLSQLTRLTTLDLNQTKITNKGLVHLKGLRKLEVLALSSTKVTDAGLLHLQGFTSLKILFLNNTKVTDGGVARLTKALPNCKIER